MTSSQEFADARAPTVRLSVILAVRNGGQYLAQQLESLVTQGYEHPWEIIVVDNASSDDTAIVARSFQARFERLTVISENRAGKSHALNTGSDVAQGELIVLVDADDEAAPGYIASMARALEQFEMVSAHIDMTYFNPWDLGEKRPSDQMITYLDYRPYIMGAILGVRASTWRRIGNFDTTLSSAEDVDFTWRASEMGVTMAMAPGALMRYRRPRTAGQNFRKARSYGRAHVALFVLHRELGQPRKRIRPELRHLKDALSELVHRQDHWQWRAAWNVGLVAGRLEESLRRRVWYP